MYAVTAQLGSAMRPIPTIVCHAIFHRFRREEIYRSYEALPSPPASEKARIYIYPKRYCANGMPQRNVDVVAVTSLKKKKKKAKKDENLISQIIHFQTILHGLIVCSPSVRVSGHAATVAVISIVAVFAFSEWTQ